MADITIYTKKNGWSSDQEIARVTDNAFGKWIATSLKAFHDITKKAVGLSISKIRLTSQANDRQSDPAGSSHRSGHAVDVAIEPVEFMVAFASYLHDNYPLDIYFGTYRANMKKSVMNRHLHIETPLSTGTNKGGLVGIECLTKSGDITIAAITTQNIGELLKLYNADSLPFTNIGYGTAFYDSLIRPSMINGPESVRYRSLVKNIPFDDYGIHFRDILDFGNKLSDPFSFPWEALFTGALVIGGVYATYKFYSGSRENKKKEIAEK